MTLHAYPGGKAAGSRFYIHARNIAASVLFVLTNGKLGEKYNVQGEAELDNLEVSTRGHQTDPRERDLPM